MNFLKERKNRGKALTLMGVIFPAIFLFSLFLVKAQFSINDCSLPNVNNAQCQGGGGNVTYANIVNNFSTINNFTNNFSTINNFTNNFSIVNNFTTINNLTNNISNNFYNNVFDQSLNTTDNVTFNNITSSNFISFLNSLFPSLTQILGFHYYNSTNFPYTSLSNFTNDIGYINWTQLNNGTFTGSGISWATATNGTLYGTGMFPYTSLSNFTDNLGNRGYTHLSNFTDNLGNRGYTSLSNFTNDGVFITWATIGNGTVLLNETTLYGTIIRASNQIKVGTNILGSNLVMNSVGNVTANNVFANNWANVSGVQIINNQNWINWSQLNNGTFTGSGISWAQALNGTLLTYANALNSTFLHTVDWNATNGIYYGVFNFSNGTNSPVLSADTNGNLWFDNKNFYWDNANNRVGIGISTPTQKLDVNGSTIIRGNLSLGKSVGINFTSSLNGGLPPCSAAAGTNGTMMRNTTALAYCNRTGNGLWNIIAPA